MQALPRRTALAALLLGVVCLGGSQWPRRKANAVAALPTDDLCIIAPPTPYDRTSGLALEAAREVPAEARCPVCGMFPARSPQWAAQIIFSNGDAQYFDSPLSLFMYLQDVARYSPGRSSGQIAAHYVTDASAPPDGKRTPWVDALSAYYVHGSSAKGPMRAGNLPAFATRAAADAFAERRGGVVLAFGAIDAALVAELASGGGHSHHQ